jgi:GNAT superfamily N-acetyltransferase
VTIRIGTATTDDLPDIVASVDALFATDAGAHNAAATNLRWATAFLAWAVDKGAQRATVTAYAANDGARRFYARHGFAVRTVTLDLDLPPEPATGNSP